LKRLEEGSDYESSEDDGNLLGLQDAPDSESEEESIDNDPIDLDNDQNEDSQNNQESG
jgi:hypothetical protein